MITKGKLFFISLIGGGSFIVMAVFVQIYGCNESIFFFCSNSYIGIVDILRIFVPLLLLSIITYKMRDAVYVAWFKFAQVWIVLSTFLIIISPEYGGGLIPIDKGRVSLTMSVLLLIISIVIIVIKSLSLRKQV